MKCRRLARRPFGNGFSTSALRPADAPPEAYLNANAMLDCDTGNASTLLQKLMVERPADMAIRGLAERLPSTSMSNLSSTSPADNATE